MVEHETALWKTQSYRGCIDRKALLTKPSLQYVDYKVPFQNDFQKVHEIIGTLFRAGIFSVMLDPWTRQNYCAKIATWLPLNRFMVEPTELRDPNPTGLPKSSHIKYCTTVV